uniref:Uncharacterized protein n=1 Tax=Rhizophagus irregularis (strain DAOM 181602 / DAOM 197198 / MUCL 43194) TaxID=747089 RepID=U9T2D3_RHIID
MSGQWVRLPDLSGQIQSSNSDIEEDCEDSNYKEDNKKNELALKLKELEYR